MNRKFRVKLGEIHARINAERVARGEEPLTPYRVAVDSGVSLNSVLKYVQPGLITDQVSTVVGAIARYYGYTFAEVVEYVETSDPEINSTLAKAS